MKLIVQRAKNISVHCDGEFTGSLETGLLVYVGFGRGDHRIDSAWVANKLWNLRVFSDEEEKMNLSCLDKGFGIMLVPNFTLYGEVLKGFRPSYGHAKEPSQAKGMFEELCKEMDLWAKAKGLGFKSGRFGSDMQVASVSDGPVNILIEKDF